MSKAGNTYWTKGQTMPAAGAERKTRSAARVRTPERAVPRWFMAGITILLSSLLVLTLNYRAWTNAQHEYQVGQQLNAEIDQLTTENYSLQDEIHRLQTDPKTIEREARKLNMGRVNEKVFVPTQ